MPVARGNANSLVKEFMAFQTLWESQKNDPKSDTVLHQQVQASTSKVEKNLHFYPNYAYQLSIEDTHYNLPFVAKFVKKPRNSY